MMSACSMHARWWWQSKDDAGHGKHSLRERHQKHHERRQERKSNRRERHADRRRHRSMIE